MRSPREIIREVEALEHAAFAKQLIGMPALSLTQPWASLMILGEKLFETRGWATRHRGRLLIHAAAGYPVWAREACLEPFFRAALGIPDAWINYKQVTGFLPLGAIIGSVEVVGCHATAAKRGELSEKELAFGDYGDRRFCFECRDPVRFEHPIPCKGALSIWKVTHEALALAVDGRGRPAAEPKPEVKAEPKVTLSRKLPGF